MNTEIPRRVDPGNNRLGAAVSDELNLLDNPNWNFATSRDHHRIV